MRQIILSAAIAATALPAWADDAALLMGVDRYQALGRVSDGSDIVDPADDLRDAGYLVGAVSNGSGRDMRRLLDDFTAEAADANRLVVGLSGRFVTDGAQSWFLAADAREPSLFGMQDTAVSLQSLMTVLARAPGQAVLVLGRDAGDDDSIDTYLREGLGPIDPPQGVTVLVADPGNVEAIISDAVVVPGGNIMALARDSRRINAIGYRPQSLILQQQGAIAEVPRPSTDSTLRFWTDAQVANTADSYRDFLFRFPESPYASEARRRLDAIENDPARLAELAEQALNLSRNERRAIQRNLTLLDFNTRGVDGIFGPGTRNAIRNWQQNNGFPQTTFLTPEQISRIDAQASRRQAEIDADAERALEEAQRLDRAYWDETGARGDQAGYRAYLDRYPEGLFAEEARSKLRQTSGNDAARAEEAALNINPVLARLIESRLAQLGYDPGRVDGQFDNETRGAIARYQTRSSLPATGYLNEPTLVRLLADTFGR